MNTKQSSLSQQTLHCLIFSEKACTIKDEKGMLPAVEYLAEETCEEGSWSVFMHILALATVINNPIYSCYPNANLGIRKFFNVKIEPRPESDCKADKNAVMILWTRDGNLDIENIFQPNHFCPIVHMYNFEKHIPFEGDDNARLETTSSNDEKVETNSPNDEKVETNSPNDEKVETNSPNDKKVETNSPSDEKVETNSLNDEKVETNSQNDEKVETNSPNDEKVETNSPNDEKVETNSPNDEKVETNSPSDEKVETNSPNDEKVETNSPSDEKVETNSPNDEKVETNSPNDEKVETNSPNDKKVETNSPSDENVETATVFTTDDDLPLTDLKNQDQFFTTDDDLPILQIKRTKTILQKKKSRKLSKVKIMEKLPIPTITDESNETLVEENEIDERNDSDIEIEDMFDLNETNNLDSWSENSTDESDDENDDKDCNIKWQKRCTQMKPKPFCGPTPGPNSEVKDRLPSDPLEIYYFYLLFPKDQITRMVEATNSYVDIYQDKKRKLTGKTDWMDKDWVDVSEAEIKVYIGLRMVMAIDKKSAIEDYWSVEPALNNAFISGVMSRNRFNQIQRYFHLVDPKKDPSRQNLSVEDKQKNIKKDPFYKVSNLLHHLRVFSKLLYNLHQDVAVDEAMIKFHGQHWAVVGAPNKPAKRGFKIFAIADSGEWIPI